MNSNPLIIFWRWINPRHPGGGNTMRVWFPIIITGLALFYFTVYYIYTSRIAVNGTFIEVDHMSGTTGNHPALDLEIVYDNNSSAHIGGTRIGRAPRLGITYNVRFANDTTAGHVAPLYSDSLIAEARNFATGLTKAIEHETDSNVVKAIDSQLRHYDTYLGLPIYLEDNNIGDICLDSVHDICRITIGMLRRDNFFMLERHRIKGDKFQTYSPDSTSALLYDNIGWSHLDNHIQWTSAYALSLSNDSVSPICGRTALKEIHSPRSVVFQSFDVSQFMEKVSFTGDVRLNSLAFFYGSTVDISKVNPVPDTYYYDGILYTDPAKLRQIERDGIFFHVGLPEMENIQIARTFAVTTILTLLLTLFIKLIRPQLQPLWDKTIGSNPLLLAALLVIVFLAIYFSLYYTIKI